jgi:hypothetical protein
MHKKIVNSFYVITEYTSIITLSAPFEEIVSS